MRSLVDFTLRETTIFRPEDGTWKAVQRHADPTAELSLRKIPPEQ